MTKRLLCLLTILYLLMLPTSAQDDSTTETIPMGTLITGTIDDDTPREAYSINGSRGTIVRIRLATSNGDLDPVLAMFNATGELIFRRDDAAGQRNVEMRVTFQETGTFLIVVGRFGYTLGTTSGDYELAIERVGISSEEGSNLQYGIPITNTITNTQPRLFFTFQAQAGDILNINMIRSSGSLDPYLQILDADRFSIADNDDADDTTRNASVQNLVINTTGTYIIVASRYGEASGNSAGSFVLTVEESSNSGLGNSQVAPASIVFNQPITAEITPERYENFYSFVGQRDQLVTIEMQRTQFAGQLDAYLILANASFQSLTENDDSQGSSNARIINFRLPADGLYFIIATRFEGEEGETSGEYTLTLTDEGNAFDGVNEGIPRLLYGTTLEDTISDEDADSIFAFWGVEGERIIIAMDATSGNLDSVLELLDSQQIRMLRDDDSGFQNNARLDTVLTYTGLHYIRTTRYQGITGNTNTTGNYRLTLTRIADN